MIQKVRSTLLQCFPKNSFAADVARSKHLRSTSSNVLFCTHYVDDVNLITVTFPLGFRVNVNVISE